MRKSLKSLMLLAALSLCSALGTPAALGAESCPNEQLRVENNSTALPDCRGYELVSPDSNGATINREFGGLTSPDGNAMVYSAIDAPDSAKSGEALFNDVRATRDPAGGWSGVSLAPPVPSPVTGYFSFLSKGEAVSADLSSTFNITDQPLLGESAMSGSNVFVGRPDGSYRRLTPVPPTNINSELIVGNADFSHVYFHAATAQLPGDHENNLYSWTEADGLRLLGILPDGTPAPDAVIMPGNGPIVDGHVMSPISADATRALFVTDGKLYLRIGDTQTVEVSASQRSIDPDPNPGPGLAPTAEFDAHILAGINASGSRVLFGARSELTNDANTGRSGGVATDAGEDLYSYDVTSGHLTDLTVDTNPADAATGANVQMVLGATPDGSSVYFTATGHLAEGAPAGHSSLYVWHEGAIAFVADASGLFAQVGCLCGVPRFYVTPDGQHAVFSSTQSLTGYDNRDAVSSQPDAEIFEANFGAGVVCVSCRVDGTRPTASTTMHKPGLGATSVISDDGWRVFFDSADAVVPQASSGVQQTFVYEGGKVSPLSRLGSSSPSTLLTATPSGNDVFFTTSDDPVPGPTAGDHAVFDARVDGGFPASTRHECSPDACRGPQSPAPALIAPASNSSSGAGNLVHPALVSEVKPKPKPLTRAQKLARALKACRSKHNKQKRSTCEKSARKKYGRKK